jgi:hypothetical protein
MIVLKSQFIFFWLCFWVNSSPKFHFLVCLGWLFYLVKINPRLIIVTVQLTFIDLQKFITAQHVTIINSNIYFSMSFIIVGCDITAHTVLLYVLFCLTYMYCTLYVLYILHTVHTVHVPCFLVSDVEVSSSTSVHSHMFTWLTLQCFTVTFT